MTEPAALWPAPRLARSSDAASLSSFGCSTGTWYEDEVEQYLQTRAMDVWRVRGPHLDHRLLLFEQGHEIVAVAAHEVMDLRAPGGVTLTGTHLTVLALAADTKGARSTCSARRLSRANSQIL